MNQLIVNMITTMNQHDLSIKVIDEALTKTLRMARKNKRKIFLLSLLGVAGFYQHEKDILKLRKQVEELKDELDKHYEPSEAVCAFDEALDH